MRTETYQDAIDVLMEQGMKYSKMDGASAKLTAEMCGLFTNLLMDLREKNEHE